MLGDTKMHGILISLNFQSNCQVKDIKTNTKYWQKLTNVVQNGQFYFPYGDQTFVEPDAIFLGEIKGMDTQLGNEIETAQEKAVQAVILITATT